MLASFWYSVGGPIQNRQTSVPYCRTVANPEDLTDIRFQRVQASDLGISTPESGSLGKPTIGGRVPHDEIGQVWRDFYRATDTVWEIYARTVTSPGAFPDGAERAEMAAYRVAFRRIAIVALLPAYRALSPHFFAWMDAVLGPEPEAPLPA